MVMEKVVLLGRVSLSQSLVTSSLLACFLIWKYMFLKLKNWRKVPMGKVLLSHSLVTSSFKDPDHQKDHDHDVDNPHDDFGYDYGVEVTTK